MKTTGTWLAALTVSAIIVVICSFAPKKQPGGREPQPEHRTGPNTGAKLMTSPAYYWHPANIFHRR